MNAPTPLAALADIDTDPQETAEWREAFLALAATEGPQRARFVLEELARLAREQRLGWQPDLNTPYLNSVSAEAQPLFPGDLALEERLASIMRWNALAMVVRANQAYGELGGHIASYASAADLFETGFHHFFHGREGLAPGQHRGDLVFFQPHSAPGVYARAFLEGRLDEQDLQHYRQEIGASAAGAQGLSSYPHPWLMPDFWQFPTGSMGIGPISSIYHARFMRYLTHRHLLDCQGRKVWGVFGDGEMDEPESMSALTLAAICSGWTARCAAMAASSTNWSGCSRARAGTWSSCCGAATGTGCSRAISQARWPRPWAPRSMGRCRPLLPRMGATTASISSARARNWPPWPRG
jgi:pyruvate dehydrogenase E1 component